MKIRIVDKYNFEESRYWGCYEIQYRKWFRWHRFNSADYRIEDEVDKQKAYNTALGYVAKLKHLHSLKSSKEVFCEDV